MLPQAVQGGEILSVQNVIRMTSISAKQCLHRINLPMQDQKYKEGCSLVEIASLHVVPARPQELDGPATQHRIAVQC